MKKSKIQTYSNLAYAEDVIRLAQNENFYGTSPLALQAIRENIDKVSQYPRVIHDRIKAKLAKKFNILSENVIISAGSVALIDILNRFFVKGGENIVFPKISFAAYKLIAEICDNEYRMAEMKNFGIDLDGILDICDEKTKAVFLANPNNPTGTFFTHEEILAFLKKINPNIYVILDEAYIEYVTNKNPPKSFELLDRFDNLIILRTFSKIYGLAGLRVGYAIAREENISKIEYCRIPFTINKLASIAALAALDDIAFVEESAKKTRKNANIYIQH